MELLKEQRVLIEKLVKANPKYSGNEDLLEDFCSETYQKSYLIFQSVEDVVSLESYLKKVVSSAIMDVLKNNGRVVRSTKGYKSVNEIPAVVVTPIKTAETYTEQENENIETQTKIAETETQVMVEDIPVENFVESVEIEQLEEISVEPEPVVEVEEYTNDNRHLKDNVPPQIVEDLSKIQDPRESLEEQIIRKDILENIINLVKQIDNEMPQEMYLKIFYERYFLELKQREIAQNIGISQAEISKRLVQLSRLIKEKLY